MDFRREFLGNGIRLVHFSMPYLRSASMMVGVGAGTRHEDAAQQGIAHLTEHISFKLPRSLSGGETIFDMFANFGADVNATTFREKTVFFTLSPAVHLGRAAEILVDMVLDPVFNNKVVRVEAGAVAQEIRGYLDDPGDRVTNLFNRLIFGADHPMGWNALGTVESVSSMAEDDVREFRRQWYTTDNIVVGVVGKFEDRFIADLRRRLESVPVSGVAGFPRVFSNCQRHPQIAVEELDTEQTYVVLGFHSYDENHSKAPILQILEKTFSSRIFSELREQRGLVYGAGAEAYFMSDCGTFEISAALDRENLQVVLDIVRGEMDRFKNDRIPAKQLRRAKASIRGSADIGWESTLEVCSFLIGQEISGREIRTPEEIIEEIDAVTSQDIREVAQEIFVDSGLNLAVVGPDLDEDELREMLTVS